MSEKTDVSCSAIGQDHTLEFCLEEGGLSKWICKKCPYVKFQEEDSPL